MDAAAALAEQLAGLARPEDRAARDALLGAALEDPAPAVREAATAWAARLLEPARLAELVADEANARLRNTALEALRRQGPYAVDHLCSMLDASDPDIVMFAIQVLALIGAPSSIPSLLPLIHHSAPNVAQSAVDALGRLKAREAVPALLALVRSDDLWLQLAAVQALGAIGDPAAAAGLLELVPGSPLAESALEALEEIGAPESLTALLDLLESNTTQALRERVARAAAAALRRADPVPDSAAAFGARMEQERGPGSRYRFLAEALASAPPAEDAPAVGDDRRSASNSPLFRAAAELVLGCGIGSLLPALVQRGASPERPDWLRGLAGRRTGALRPALAGLVTDPDGAVREGTLRIATFRPEDGGMLLPLLHDPVPAVREAACRAIGRVGESSAIPWLLERLRAGTPGERRAATEALGQMPGAALVGMAPYLAPGAERELVLAALDVLARSGSDVFENRTLELARSAEPDLRRAALRALAAIPGTRTEVVLFRALADRAREVQAEALELLVRRGGARVIQALLALLGANDSLRYHVIRALGRLRATDAAAQLERLYPACPPHEQLEIISALSSIRPPELRTFLRDRLAEEDVEFRRAAARGLAGAVTEGDLDLLITLAADRDWFVRNEAARGLGALKLPASRPALLDLVRDVEAVVAATARGSLDALAATPGG